MDFYKLLPKGGQVSQGVKYIFSSEKNVLDPLGPEVPDPLTVIHDDLDLPFGTFKVATDSGAAGHNGVASVIEHLGTKEFRRIRIGIGRPKDGRDPADYVLARFTDEEEQKLPEIFEEIFAEM